MRITYFVHSTTADNVQKIASGWNDVPLSLLGEAQARELKQAVHGTSFQAVYASDLVRARQTAGIVFGTGVTYDARLRECNYGVHNGGPASVVNDAIARGSMEAFPAGESLADVEYRMRSLLTELATRHAGHDIAFVSHRFPQLALDVIVNNVSWPEALERDWRKTGAWQPGWVYNVQPLLSNLIDGGSRH